MAAPFDSPFNANSDITQSQKYAVNCRHKSLWLILCLLTCVSSVIIAAHIHIHIIIVFLFSLSAGTFIGSLFCAASAFINGTIWLIGYRTKQGAFSVVGGWLLSLLWLLLPVACYLITPSVSNVLSGEKTSPEVYAAKQIGTSLFSYANDHDGIYPGNLTEFINTEMKHLDRKEIKRLLYQKNGKQLRWTLTPGLTTNDPSNTILLQSVEKVKEDNREYLIVYTVGNSAEAVKNPDENIVIISGRPTLRQK